jgi:uncharacterized membrane protein YdbT with pleckstrin-like domain
MLLIYANEMSTSAVSSIELLEGEQIEHDVQPAWSKWGGIIIISLIASLFVIGIIGLVYVYLARSNHRYIITNQRVVETSGVLGTSTTEYRISDIRSIQTGATIFEQLLNQGNVQIATGTLSNIVFNGIPNYQEVSNSIRKTQKELE